MSLSIVRLSANTRTQRYVNIHAYSLFWTEPLEVCLNLWFRSEHESRRYLESAVRCNAAMYMSWSATLQSTDHSQYSVHCMLTTRPSRSAGTLVLDRNTPALRDLSRDASWSPLGRQWGRYRQCFQRASTTVWRLPATTPTKINRCKASCRCWCWLMKRMIHCKPNRHTGQFSNSTTRFLTMMS